jgi:hypothetical protein
VWPGREALLPRVIGWALLAFGCACMGAAIVAATYGWHV